MGFRDGNQANRADRPMARLHGGGQFSRYGGELFLYVLVGIVGHEAWSMLE
jgi:hypothetical protein